MNEVKIFIGSSSEAADKTNPNNILLKVAEIIRGAKAIPVAWNDNDYNLFSIGKTTIENLETIVERMDIEASVFIYSADDKIWWRDKIDDKIEEKNAPRDNVLFEHGLFSGKLGREKSIIIKYGEVVKIPSDLYGVTYIDLSDKNKESGERQLIRWIVELIKSKRDDENMGSSNVNNNNQEIIYKQNTLISKHDRMIELVLIPEGVYHRIIDDKRIKIDNPLFISKYLITQSIYNSIMGSNHLNHFTGDSLPVEKVSFRDAVTFCNILSNREGYDEVYRVSNQEIQWNENAKGYRLPFEIEWEYALGYDCIEIQENLDSLAWYNYNSGNKTHVVGLKKENDYGLFDLLGNVWEWCFDSYENNPPQTPVLKNDCSLKVLRGGSFAEFKSAFTKNAFRKKENEFVSNRFTGFRVVLQ